MVVGSVASSFSPTASASSTDVLRGIARKAVVVDWGIAEKPVIIIIIKISL
jgi:hypothetical protein